VIDPHCLIASAHGAKAAVAKMIENRFCHNRMRGIKGAQEEYVERVDYPLPRWVEGVVYKSLMTSTVFDSTAY
jgi:hypothetical protein